MKDFKWLERDAMMLAVERREDLEARFLGAPSDLPTCRTTGCDWPVLNQGAVCIGCQVKAERSSQDKAN